MVRIVSDTSTLYSKTQAKEAGFDVTPLFVTIAGNSYLEFEEISPSEFVKIIYEGNMPTSSQPAVGSVAQVYEQYPNDEILNISMADGLSGTYNGAVAAKGLVANSDNITVINSKTLCGPHRYMVECAKKMAEAGKSMKEILAKLDELIASSRSFLMPADFDYLRRGGRLSPLVSFVGQTAHLVPVMTLTEDCTRLIVATVRRGFAGAFKFVTRNLEKYGVGEGWRVYVTHADAIERAEEAVRILKESLPKAIFEIHPLSPAFITQGGPGCVAIQVIKD